jgi:hypothetical protein
MMMNDGGWATPPLWERGGLAFGDDCRSVGAKRERRLRIRWEGGLISVPREGQVALCGLLALKSASDDQ